MEIRGWARTTGSIVAADMSVSMRHGETYDRRSHYWPIFHPRSPPRTATASFLLGGLQICASRLKEEGWAPISARGEGGRKRSGDRGGADKTTVLCKPRYQCGVNRALTPSAGNQPLPLLPSTSWVFAGLLLERACHAPV